MQHGARFVILKVPFGVPCWVKSGRQKCYKSNVFLLIFKIMGAPGLVGFRVRGSQVSKSC